MSRFLVEVCYVWEEFCSALLSLLQTERSTWGLDASEDDLRGMDPLSESCTGLLIGDKDSTPPEHSHQWHQVLPLSSALLSCCSPRWPSQADPNALLWAQPPAAPCLKDRLNNWCPCSQHFTENSKATTGRSKAEGAKIQNWKKLIKTRSAKGEFQADSLILIYMKLPAESCWKLDNSTCLVRMRETLGFIFNITKSFLFQPSEGSTWMLHQDNLWRLFQPPCEQRDSHCLLKLAGTHVHAQMWCQLGHSCRRNKAARNHVPAADLAENMSCLLLFLHRVGSEQRHTWKLPGEHWAFCCKVKHAGSECTAEGGFWRWLSDELNWRRVRRKHRRLWSEVKPSLSPLEVHRNTKDPIPMSTPNFYSRWNRFSKPGVKGSKETLL